MFYLYRNGEEWAKLRRKLHKKMLSPVNLKVFYPLFSDVAIDAIDYLKGLRDENSVIYDVREEVLGKWALECKYLMKPSTCTGNMENFEMKI